MHKCKCGRSFPSLKSLARHRDWEGGRPKRRGGEAQLEARRPVEPKVVGSRPITPAIPYWDEEGYHLEGHLWQVKLVPAAPVDGRRVWDVVDYVAQEAV